jgi:hypothetical protein
VLHQLNGLQGSPVRAPAGSVAAAGQWYERTSEGGASGPLLTHLPEVAFAEAPVGAVGSSADSDLRRMDLVVHLLVSAKGHCRVATISTKKACRAQHPHDDVLQMQLPLLSCRVGQCTLSQRAAAQL